MNHRTAPGGLIDVTARTWRQVPGVRAHVSRIPDPGITIDAIPIDAIL